MLNLKTFYGLCVLGFFLIAASGCSQDIESGKVIGYPAEKQSGHVFFLKEGWQNDLTQESNEGIKRVSMVKNWLDSINGHVIPEKPKGLSTYVTEDNIQSYLDSVKQVTSHLEFRKNNTLNNLKNDLIQAQKDQQAFDVNYQAFLDITQKPKENYESLKARRAELKAQLKAHQDSARAIVNTFVATHDTQAKEILKINKAIKNVFQTKLSKSSCTSSEAKKDRYIYQYKPTQFGVEAMCYKVSIAKYGQIKKDGSVEDVKRLEQKLTPIVNQYLEAQNELSWHVVDKTRTVASIQTQYTKASRDYSKALRTAFQKTKLGSNLNKRSAEKNIKHSLKLNHGKTERIQAQITQLEGTVISINELNRGIKPAKNKLVKQAQDKILSELLAVADKYFIGSVPIDTDGTFRVLPDSGSAIMVVQRKPKGFLNNLSDRRLIVDTLLLDTNSEMVKNRGVIEFDYSKSLLDKKPIRLVASNNEKRLMLEILGKYEKKTQ